MPTQEEIERVELALREQMEEQDETLPSSIARERGLVWLEGWFDLERAILAMREGK
jgi:hypothetical protein